MLIKGRRRSRELALEMLYQAEIRGQLPREALAAHLAQEWSLSDLGEVASPPDDILAYVRVLVDGVQEHLADIDARIAQSADRWKLERMAVIDKNLLRMATFELLHRPDVPKPVVVNEAVELAKAFSTEDSGRFVNGVLGELMQGLSPQPPSTLKD